jgi:hypothetical protein
MEQEETPPPKDEWPWARQKGKFFISCISLVASHLNFQKKLIYIAW